MNKFKKILSLFLHYFRIAVSLFILVAIAVVIKDFLHAASTLKQDIEENKNFISFERLDPLAEFRVLFVGDSSVVGFGSEDANSTIAGRFGSSFPRAEVVNEGIFGQGVGGLVESFNPSRYENLDIIFIQIGANDIVRRTALNSLARDLQKVLRSATEVAPVVVLSHSPDLGDIPIVPIYASQIFTRQTRQVRDLFLKIAENYDVIYVDLFDVLEGVDDVSALFAKDGFHPNGAGYKIWYEAVIEALRENGVAVSA